MDDIRFTHVLLISPVKIDTPAGNNMTLSKPMTSIFEADELHIMLFENQLVANFFWIGLVNPA